MRRCQSDITVGLRGKTLEQVLTRRNVDNNFKTFRLLGKGAFGSVFARKKAKTGVCFASKFMDKRAIAANKAENVCWNEFYALMMCQSAFVVSLKYAYQTNAHLVLNLELMTGGDLDFQLRYSDEGRLDSHSAAFCAAEVLLGLEHLHSLGLVYRDLKPGNILMDDEGHCRISDLGLCVPYHQELFGHAWPK